MTRGDASEAGGRIPVCDVIRDAETSGVATEAQFRHWFHSWIGSTSTEADPQVDELASRVWNHRSGEIDVPRRLLFMKTPRSHGGSRLSPKSQPQDSLAGGGSNVGEHPQGSAVDSSRLRVPDVRPYKISPEHWPRVVGEMYDPEGRPLPGRERHLAAWKAEAETFKKNVVLGYFMLGGFLLWFCGFLVAAMITGGLGRAILLLLALTVVFRVWLGVRWNDRLKVHVRHLEAEADFLRTLAPLRIQDPEGWERWAAYCRRQGFYAGVGQLLSVFGKATGLYLNAN
jgi:hypothetical protein